MADNTISIENYADALVADIASSIENEVKATCEQALIDAINTTVYLRQKTYRQTRGFVDAVEIMDMNIRKNSGIATFRIGVNASKMGIEIRTPDEWNAHAGMKGQDFREGLIETLDEGSSGSPYYNFSGYGFFDKAADNLDRTMIQAMANALKAKGYKVDIY